MALLKRLSGAVLAVPLLICQPFLRSMASRRRKQRAIRGRRAVGAAPATPGQVRRATSVEVHAMVEALGKILDEHDDSRHVFRHVARFERKFGKRGLRILEEMPIDDLRRSLRDFESMVRNWSSTPLADLRSRMAVALSVRASASTMWIAQNSVAARSIFTMGAAADQVFRISQQVDVGDVSISRFEAAGGQWSPSRSGA